MTTTPPRPRSWAALSRLSAGGIVLAAVLSLAGCGGLEFRHDAHVQITEPASLARVTTPVHLRWTGTLRSGGRTFYAVFVDSLPVHPGQNLRSLAGPTCAGVRGCVDLAWLNRHFVFLTDRSQLDLETLPILGTPKGDPDAHTATVVLVNRDWQRLGESAWSVTFMLGSPAPT